MITRRCIIVLLLSHSVGSDSLRPQELQHSMFPCPSPTPGVCWNSCPLSWWCHPTISSSVLPFSSCPHSFLTSGSLPMHWLLASGGQSIGASASASVLPMNIQDWFPLELTGLIPLLSRGVSRIYNMCITWSEKEEKGNIGFKIRKSLASWGDQGGRGCVRWCWKEG